MGLSGPLILLFFAWRQWSLVHGNAWFGMVGMVGMVWLCFIMLPLRMVGMAGIYSCASNLLGDGHDGRDAWDGWDGAVLVCSGHALALLKHTSAWDGRDGVPACCVQYHQFGIRSCDSNLANT